MIYLSLGTNLGDGAANLEQAIHHLNANQIEVVARSSIYQTAPRDVVDQPWFLNMVVECRTSHSPDELIRRVLDIEKQMGRDRSSAAVPRGPRLIDIDILLYGDLVVQTPQLTIPHPRILARRFVLQPLLELAPDIKNPRTGVAFATALPAVQHQEIKAL